MEVSCQILTGVLRVVDWGDVIREIYRAQVYDCVLLLLAVCQVAYPLASEVSIFPFH